MTTFFYAALIIVPAVVLMLSAFFTFRSRFNGKSAKKSMRINFVTFLVLILMVSILAFGVSATSEAPNTDAAPVQTTEQTT